MNAIAPLRIDKPGLYRITSKRYHEDPIIEPSLSHSIARHLMGEEVSDSSPLHAHDAHPRYCTDYEPMESTRAMDDGSILHALTLGEGTQYRALPFDNYQKKIAQAARDQVRDAGYIPILEKHMDELRRAAGVVRKRIEDHPDCQDFFAPGHSEITAVWKEFTDEDGEGGIWCRSLLDRIPERPGAPLFDLKFSGMSVGPKKFTPTIQSKYATQAVFHGRGAIANLDVPPQDFRFIAAEVKRPNAIVVYRPSERLLEIAEKDVKTAMVTWLRCTILDEWPGYAEGIVDIEPSARDIIRAGLSLSGPQARPAITQDIAA